MRIREIFSELIEPKAETLILLGNLPIECFLKHYADRKYKKLADFGESSEYYGKPVEVKIEGMHYNAIALCHHRQAGQLGTSSIKLKGLHNNWITQMTDFETRNKYNQ